MMVLAWTDWAHFRGPHYDGISREPASANELKEQWRADVGTGFSSIIAVGGHIYTLGNMDQHDVLWCLRVDSGEVVWQARYPEPLDPNMYEGGPNATPTYAQGLVFTLSKKGQLKAFDASSGKQVWSRGAAEFEAIPPIWGYSGSATVVGDTVIYNVGDRGLALVAKTGERLWSSSGQGAGYATAIPLQIGKRQAVLMMAGNELLALAVDDGSVLWRYPWSTSYNVNAATPTMEGQRVFISSGYGHGGALLDIRGKQPSKVWENKNLRNHFSNSVMVGGFIYGVDGQSGGRGTLTCLDGNTGAVRWQERSLRFGSVLVAGEMMMVLDERGTLIRCAVSPEGFREIDRMQILPKKCWTVPTYANGRLFARDARGHLVCMK